MRLPLHVRLHSYTKIRRRAQWFRNGGSGAIKTLRLVLSTSDPNKIQEAPFAK